MAAEGYRYRVHRIEVSMTKDEANLERFLDGLEGEVVSIVPNVTVGFLWMPRVDFLLVVEKVPVWIDVLSRLPRPPKMLPRSAIAPGIKDRKSTRLNSSH